MFEVIDKEGKAPVRIFFDGRAISAYAGQSVAAALLAAGVHRFRTTPVKDTPRMPYCMMGVCFDCLIVVDGLPNVQACTTEVRDGMRVETQKGRFDLAGQDTQPGGEA